MKRFFVLLTVIIGIGLLAGCSTVPEKVGKMYSLESAEHLNYGKLKSYVAAGSTIEVANEIIANVGRPEEMTNLSSYEEYDDDEYDYPIVLMYDDDVITIEKIDTVYSRVEVADYKVAQSRHHSAFAYYWGPSYYRYYGHGYFGHPGRTVIIKETKTYNYPKSTTVKKPVTTTPKSSTTKPSTSTSKTKSSSSSTKSSSYYNNSSSKSSSVKSGSLSGPKIRTGGLGGKGGK